MNTLPVKAVSTAVSFYCLLTNKLPWYMSIPFTAASSIIFIKDRKVTRFLTGNETGDEKIPQLVRLVFSISFIALAVFCFALFAATALDQKKPLLFLLGLSFISGYIGCVLAHDFDREKIKC